MQKFAILLLSIFFANISAVIFDCNFFIAKGGFVGNVYTCKPNVTNSGRLDFLTEVRGNHLQGKEHENVEAIYVLAQILHFLPSNLASYFPNLRAIWCYESKLLEISAENLRPFPNLMELGVRTNQLESIDGDLFKHSPKLKWIYFSDNQIQHVGYDLLTDSKDLQAAIFERNPCINANAQGQIAIQELNKLLPIKCRCEIKCSIGTDVKNMMIKMEILEESNIQDKKQMTEMMIIFEERLVELEKQVRELNSNPSSPCKL